MLKASRMSTEEREWIFNEIELVKSQKSLDFNIDDAIEVLSKRFREKFGDIRSAVITAKKVKEIMVSGPVSRSSKSKIQKLVHDDQSEFDMDNPSIRNYDDNGATLSASKNARNKAYKRPVDMIINLHHGDDGNSSDSSDAVVRNSINMPISSSNNQSMMSGDSPSHLTGMHDESSFMEDQTMNMKGYRRPGRNNPSLLPAGSRPVKQSINNHSKGLKQKLDILCLTIDELNRRNDYKRPRIDYQPLTEEDMAQANLNVQSAVDTLCQAIMHRQQLISYVEDPELSAGYMATSKDCRSREMYTGHNLTNEGIDVMNQVAYAVFGSPSSG